MMRLAHDLGHEFDPRPYKIPRTSLGILYGANDGVRTHGLRCHKPAL